MKYIEDNNLKKKYGNIPLQIYIYQLYMANIMEEIIDLLIHIVSVILYDLHLTSKYYIGLIDIKFKISVLI